MPSTISGTARLEAHFHPFSCPRAGISNTLEGAAQVIGNKRGGTRRAFMLARGPQVHLDSPEGLPHDEIAGGSNGFSWLLVDRKVHLDRA